MISTIKKKEDITLMSLNVLISDVKDGCVIYEPITKLMAFGAYSHDAKQIIREKIVALFEEDENSIIDKFTPSKIFENTWLYVITMVKAIEESEIQFDNVDVTSINISACQKKQEDTIMVSHACH